MKKVKHLAQLIVFDGLAIVFMMAAILLGWLPGPGGIPLFLIGLSLLAINHQWAQKYIDLFRKYADNITDLIFVPRRARMFDILGTFLLLASATMLFLHNSPWQISLGLICFGMSVFVLLGNNNRWKRLKQHFKNHKHK